MTITLVDVENRNTLGQQMIDELIAAIDTAEHTASVRVVVLTNAGTVFCAGANLSERSSESATSGARSKNTFAELLTRIRRSPLPFVGRINGHAVAGGLGLVAALDLSVAIDTAKHGFTEVRVGVAPAMISVVCLPRMRHAEAAAAMLRGNRFLAPEAERLGLINHAVPAAELDVTVQAIVTDLLAGGPNAIAATKRLLYRVPELSYDDALDWTEELSTLLFRTEEARDGMTAYLSKSPAPWVQDSPKTFP